MFTIENTEHAVTVIGKASFAPDKRVFKLATGDGRNYMAAEQIKQDVALFDSRFVDSGLTDQEKAAEIARMRRQPGSRLYSARVILVDAETGDRVHAYMNQGVLVEYTPLS